MHSALQILGNAFVEKTYGDSLISLSEGFIKVRCIEAALSLGWTIQEGAGRSPLGDVADFAVSNHGRITWWRAKRRIRLDQGSSDVAIVEPIRMLLEVKARPDYGTKSQAQFQQMDADVDRIAGNPICCCFFVFDMKIYRSFSGEKRDTRGRPALASGWFIKHFPKLADLPSDGWLVSRAPRGESHLTFQFRRCSHLSSADTVIALGAQHDSNLQ